MREEYHVFVTATTAHIEETDYITYGITICSEEGVASVNNLSTNFVEVNALCARLRRGRLSPRHLRDVVEDWFVGG